LYTLSRGNLVTLVKALLQQAASKLAGFDVMRLGTLSITDLQSDTGAVQFWMGYCRSILIVQQPLYGTHMYVQQRVTFREFIVLADAEGSSNVYKYVFTILLARLKLYKCVTKY
jgi:hypothetical protein